jgi:hypothetical protein
MTWGYGPRDRRRAGQDLEGFVFRRVVFAAAMLAASAAFAAEPPTDARSCAVRYKGAAQMLAGANADADVLSAKFAERAVAMLVKGGLLKAGAELPKDVADEGRAYSASWARLEKETAEVEAEVRACDRKHGFPALFPG